MLTARASGAAGTGITVSGTTSASANVTVTAYSPNTCCAVLVPGSVITAQNPALPGEIVTLMATGIGAVTDLSGNPIPSPADGIPYPSVAPYQPNTPASTVSSTVGSSTGEIIAAGYPPYSYGVAQVQVLIPSTLTTNPNTQITIAQNAFVSNTATIPIGNGAEILPGGYILNSGPAQGYPSPAFATFGNLGGATQTSAITFSNIGGVPLTFSAITLAGPNASDFSINQSATTCNVLVPLQSGSNCYVSLIFTRKAPGTRNATLTFTDNAYLTTNSAASVSQAVSLQGLDTQNFSIISPVSGLAFDVYEGSSADGIQIQQYNFTNGANQLWNFVPVGQYYQIVNVNSGKVLDDPAASTTPGTLIQQYHIDGGDNQLWQLIPQTSGNYSIVNKLSGLALDLFEASHLSGVLIQEWTYSGGINQQWTIAPTSYVQIVNKNSGLALDVPAGSLAAGANIQQWNINGGPNQQWTITPSTTSPYQTITNRNSSLVLDNPSASTSDGTQMDQAAFADTDEQQWLLVPDGKGYFVIYNKVSGKVLDVFEGSQAPGTAIQQYFYDGGDNQKWQIVPVQ